MSLQLGTNFFSEDQFSFKYFNYFCCLIAFKLVEIKAFYFEPHRYDIIFQFTLKHSTLCLIPYDLFLYFNFKFSSDKCVNMYQT